MSDSPAAAAAANVSSPASVRHVLTELELGADAGDYLDAPPASLSALDSATPNRLVTLASAPAKHESPQAKPKFQPRPLPMPGQDATRILLTRQTEAATTTTTAAATTSAGGSSSSLPVPTKKEVFDSPPKLLASLNSGFTYQHSTVHESPSLRHLDPNRDPRAGRAGRMARHGKVRFGSEDLGPTWVQRALAGGSSGGGASAGGDQSTGGTPDGSPLVQHADTSRSPSTHHRQATAGVAKKLKARASVKERSRVVQVAHVGGKVITTISHRTVQPSASQAEVITTVLGSRKPNKGKPYADTPAGGQSKPVDKDNVAAASPSSSSSPPLTVGAPRLTWMQLRYIFFLVTILQVAFCCAIVWYLGYLNARATGLVLGNQARAAITDHVEDVLNNYASEVLQATSTLALLTTMRLPEWTKMGGMNATQRASLSIVSTPGLLADLSYILSAFPHIPLVALSSPTIHLTVRRNHTLGQHMYQIMDPALPALLGRPTDSANTLYEFHFDRSVYYAEHPGTDESNAARLRQSIAYFQPLGDFDSDDDPLSMLGPVVRSSVFYPETQSFYPVAKLQNTSALVWAGPVPLTASGYGQLGVAAIKPMQDNLETPDHLASGELSLIAFTLFYLDFIRTKILLDIKQDLGTSGCLFLVEGNGLLVATTLAGYTDEYTQRTQLLTTSDPFIWKMMDVLDPAHLFDLTVNPRNDSRTRRQEDWVAWNEYIKVHPNSTITLEDVLNAEGGASAATSSSGETFPSRPYTFTSGEPVTLDSYPGGVSINDRHFIVGGTDWHVNALTLRLPGLDWVLIVCTQDDDFDGGLNSTKVTVGWLAALVAVVAAIVSLAVAHCISRPLMRLVSFMENVSSMLHRKQPASTVDGDATAEELSLMCAEWNDAMRSLQRGGSLASMSSSSWKHPSSSSDSPSTGGVGFPLSELSDSSDFTDEAEDELDGAHGIGGVGGAPGAGGSVVDSRRFSNLSRRGSIDQGGPSGGGAGSSRFVGQHSRKNSNSVVTGMLDQTMKALSPPAAIGATTTRGEAQPSLQQQQQLHSITPNQPTARLKRPTTATMTHPKSGTLARGGASDGRSKTTFRAKSTAFWSKHMPPCIREFPMRETQLLQHTFGAMLESLRKNHQQLQTANESKRRFIRYIFHEVRVPFNAIVLGVEQLREDLYTEPLRPVEEMQDVVNILNEQSKVVARILNDVLSLQKIEDGALQLEMAPFNLLELICGTLRSFQPLFTEKKLSLLTDLQSLEESMATHAKRAWKRANAMQREVDAAAGRVGTAPAGEDHLLTGGDTPLDMSPAQESRSHLPPVGEQHHPQADGIEMTEQKGASADADGALRQLPQPDSRPAVPPTLAHTPSQSVNQPSSPGAIEQEILRCAHSYSHDVLGDRYRLRQVFANFLSNAVKFSPFQSSVHVGVSCRAIETAAERAARRAETAERAARTATAAAATAAGSTTAAKDAKAKKPTHTKAVSIDAEVRVDVHDRPAHAPEVEQAMDELARQQHQQYESSFHAHSLTMPNGFTWTPPNQVMVRVSVRDSGRGLSLFEQQQLFQPYIQLSSGEQQEGKGTGLGLNISKSLIELHGGVIGVSSSGVHGAGCEFFFEMPMTIVPSGHRSATASPQVFHVSHLKGPATMRAWHSPAPALRGLTGSADGKDSPSIVGGGSVGATAPPVLSSDSPSGVSISVNGPDGASLQPKLPLQKNSPSLFSLQSTQHTSAPLTLAVRQRMLERSHQGNNSLSIERRDFHPPTVAGHMPSELVSFSPLVGSSRRVATTYRQNFAITPIENSPALTSPLGGKELPTTPGTQQIIMMNAINGGAGGPPATSHLNKLALLQGLANDSVSYGYGYSSRPQAASKLAYPVSTTMTSGDAGGGIGGVGLVVSHTSRIPAGDSMASVLTPMGDDETNEADLVSLDMPTGSSSKSVESGLTPSVSGWNILPSHIQTPHQGGLAGDLTLPPVPTRNSPRVYLDPHLEAAERAHGDAYPRSPSDHLPSGQSIPFPRRRASVDSTGSSWSNSSLGPLPSINMRRRPSVDLMNKIAEASAAATAAAAAATAAATVTAFPKVDSAIHTPVSTPVGPKCISRHDSGSKPTRPMRLHVGLGLNGSRAHSAASTPVKGLTTSQSSTPIAPPSAEPAAVASHGHMEYPLVSTAQQPPASSTVLTSAVSSSASSSSTHASSAGSASTVANANATPASAISVSTPSGSPTPADTATADSTANSSPPFRPRILVVEDSAPNRKLLLMLLRALKCDVVGVENGLLAVQEFAPHATERWVGANVAGRLDHAAAGMGAKGPAGSTPHSLLSPSGAAASAELVRMGLSPSGLSPTRFDFQSHAGAPEASSGSPNLGVDPTASSPSAAGVPSKYDLVFIDGNMPVMNGIEATRNIRGLGLTLPIIAVTGNAHEDDVASFHSAGIDRILLKPASRAALQATLKDFLPNFVATNSAVKTDAARAKRLTQ